MAEDEVDVSDLSDIEVGFDSLIFIRLITNMWRGTGVGEPGRIWGGRGMGARRRKGRKRDSQGNGNQEKLRKILQHCKYEEAGTTTEGGGTQD